MGGCFSAQTPPSPESSFYPPPPFTPYTFTLPHTAAEWLLLCPLTQTFPQKRGRKLFTPLFYLLSPQPTPHPLRGCIGAKKGIPPHFLSSLLSLPPISHTRTHTRTGTHGQEHRRTYKLNPPGQQLYMR